MTNGRDGEKYLKVSLMIKHLKHKEIDKEKWDSVVLESPNGSIYSLSWYLDAVSPNWQALVINDYETVFPLPVKKKFGLSYLIQPNYLQKFRIITKEFIPENAMEILDWIKNKYSYTDIRIEMPAIESSQLQYVNTNFELNLTEAYSILYSRFSQNHKKNIRSSLNKELTVKKENDYAELIRFTHLNLKSKTTHFKEKIWSDLKILLKQIERRGIGQIYSVYDNEGEKIASALTTCFNNRYYLMLNSATEAGRKKRAPYFLVNYFIEEKAETRTVLDFEGSNINSIAYFFEGYGAIEKKYSSFTVNKLHWLKRLKTK